MSCLLAYFRTVWVPKNKIDEREFLWRMFNPQMVFFPLLCWQKALWQLSFWQMRGRHFRCLRRLSIKKRVSIQILIQTLVSDRSSRARLEKLFSTSNRKTFNQTKPISSENQVSIRFYKNYPVCCRVVPEQEPKVKVGCSLASVAWTMMMMSHKLTHFSC